MANYRPQLDNTIPLMLLKPTYKTVSGVTKKDYPEVADGVLFYGSFKSYGGTETTINGVYGIEDTANVETWYNPEIKADCLIGIPDSGAVYDIINEPENVNMRNQFMKFKVRRAKGGA